MYPFGGELPNVIFEERLIGEFSELQLQFRLILRVAGQIWQILQISAVICRILQIPPGSANSNPKFLSKKLAKVCSQKILQSIPLPPLHPLFPSLVFFLLPLKPLDHNPDIDPSFSRVMNYYSVSFYTIFQVFVQEFLFFAFG